jgi:hypothetical protein
MEKEKARLLVYDKYKRNIRSKFSKTSKGCFEEYVKRRVTISYFDFGKIQDVILRDAQKALLRYEVK